MARLFRSLYEFPRPTIAAVNGPAIAGGCGLATLCDFTLASDTAKFGYTEVRIGFLPALVSTWLVRQIGDKAARNLLLTGKIISAEEALRIGLVTEVVAPGQLLERAKEIALQLLENSPTSLTATKQLLNGYAQRDLPWQLEAAVEANAAIRTTEDFREGVSSFLEKRKPKWAGRGKS
jgi:methylglutaconyl-CoA hydratase